MSIRDFSIEEFRERLAGSAPVPGGGSASALCGSVAASLAAMVGSLTTGKPKFKDIESDVRANLEKAEDLSARLLDAADRDMEVFEPLAKAYSMPSGTEEEKKAKDEYMEKVLYEAALPPLDIMELCSEAIDICGYFAENGSRLAISDAGSGAIIAKSAIQAASLNVFINTGSMKDKEKAQELNERADALLTEYTIKADEVYSRVYAILRKWHLE